MVAPPTDSNITPDAHGIHQPDGCPDRAAAPEPERVADLFANEPGHLHPDRHTGQAGLVPPRSFRSVLRAEVHEVSFEIPTAPLMRPHSEHVPNVGFSIGMRDIENVVFLAAFVPTELTVEFHRRQWPAGDAIGDDPV